MKVTRYKNSYVIEDVNLQEVMQNVTIDAFTCYLVTINHEEVCLAWTPDHIELMSKSHFYECVKPWFEQGEYNLLPLTT